MRIFFQWRRSVALDTTITVPISWEHESLSSITNASTASGYHGTTTSGSVPLMYNRRKSETESTIYCMEGLTIGSVIHILFHAWQHQVTIELVLYGLVTNNRHLPKHIK